MDVTKWKLYTRLLLAIIAGVGCLYDFIVMEFVGVDASISKIVYYLAADYPILAVLIGMLVGHFFWPQWKGKD